MIIQRLSHPEQDWVMDFVTQSWGGEPLVGPSGIHRVRDLVGYGAFDGDKPIGFLHYRIAEDGLEVVLLSALTEHSGVGTALMNKAREIASAGKCERLWLVTTSDNPRAIGFYNHLGMEETERLPNYSDEVRRHKPNMTASYDAVIFELTPV